MQNWVIQDKNQNLDELQESEGALNKDNTCEKNKGDFALWKTSKKDEPFWDHKEKNKSFNVLIESFWEFLLPLVPLLIMLSLMPKIK